MLNIHGDRPEVTPLALIALVINGIFLRLGWDTPDWVDAVLLPYFIV